MAIQTEPVKLEEVGAIPPALTSYEPAADEAVPVEAEEDEGEDGLHRLMIDPTKWLYHEYVTLMRQIIIGEWEKAFPLIMKATIGWTYDIPFEPEAYRKLPYSDLPLIGEAVMAVVAEFTTNLDLSLAKLKMSRWDMDDFFNYKAAVRAGNTEVRERLMRKLSRMAGLSKDRRMTFVEGATISHAIDEGTKSMFASGKSPKQPIST